ncbi:hypothetical protein IF690_08460 [Pseudomonas sp. SK3(2021)]|uniref:hypothetical protein n=1 Tax=Pseudomonas sp. SK3(2021) TaxID=2841064 RepID=UPI00192CCC7E|nr:hypothetical protein [Pseudomonas sp. SK3(2021)]QQZ43559.1 hypothetical protein IF690_08460 [Pseudomonas sp. SK3(2021)]
MFNERADDLKIQIEIALVAIQAQLKSSGEVVIAEYLKKYQDALVLLESGSQDEVVKKLRAILGCSRGYMESSSNYDQDFLQEMWRTEVLIKQKLS